MSNQIQFQAFNFQSNSVRIITDPNQEFWFCANDVCSILDYANPRQAVQKNCKPKGVSIRDTLTSGGNQEMVYINEPNLYRLIIKSRKPEAEPFEAWVFEEVLPQIRKTGQYSQNAQPNLPLIEEKTHTLTLTDRELHRLCWLWKMAEIMRQLIGFVQKPLELLGSRYAASAWGYSNEYKFSLEKTRQILVRETAHVQPDPLDRHGWNNVIHELRSGKIR